MENKINKNFQISNTNNNMKTKKLTIPILKKIKVLKFLLNMFITYSMVKNSLIKML